MEEKTLFKLRYVNYKVRVTKIFKKWYTAPTAITSQK